LIFKGRGKIYAAIFYIAWANIFNSVRPNVNRAIFRFGFAPLSDANSKYRLFFGFALFFADFYFQRNDRGIDVGF
jgi:hypothetical protein